MVSAGLGPLHNRHPLVIIAEEGEVEIRAAAVGLSTDGQLTQQPTHRLCMAAIFSVHYGVLESEAHTHRDISAVTLNSNRSLYSQLAPWPWCKDSQLKHSRLNDKMTHTHMPTLCRVFLPVLYSLHSLQSKTLEIFLYVLSANFVLFCPLLAVSLSNPVNGALC